MINLAELKADLADAVADFATAFVDGSTTLQCVTSAIDSAKQVQFGGIQGKAKLRCIIPLAAFPNGYAGPTIGKVVSINGHEYRVFDLTKDPQGIFVEAILGDKFERQ